MTERGWVDVCETDAGRRRERHRAERVLHSRPRHSNRAPKSSSSISMCSRRVKANVSIPVAIKVGPYFSSFADMACQPGGSRGRRARAVQSLLSARLRHRDADRCPVARVEQARRDSVAAALDRAAARSGVGLACGDHRGARRRRSHQVPDGRRGRRDEHLCPAAAGPAVSRASPRGHDDVDGAEGVHLCRARCGAR